MLRERREAMGVTLAEVEVATRIRQKYLSALEAEEWHLLPGEVVGRGFLRNYADYLGMDAQDVIDRRRATTDVSMSNALATTSAGSMLPPERVVDYRPKEVELKDEGDGIQRGEIRLTPILMMLAVALVVGGVVWGILTLREPLGDMLAGAQSGVAGLFEQAQPTATLTGMGVVNEENLTNETTDAAEVGSDGVVVLGSGGDAGVAASNAAGGVNVAPPTPENVVVLVPTDTPAVAAAAPTPAPATPEAPTATPEAPTPAPPTPEPPTATPEPPTPEPPTPEPPTPEPPTPEPPTAEPQVFASAACGDGRSLISGLGVNQVLSGVASVTGNATHEAFQYYKMEYAPGANAGGGFVYFAGSNVPISGGVLGNLDTRSLPNGEYTIRLTVVDQSGNFPPPCDVTIVIQN